MTPETANRRPTCAERELIEATQAGAACILWDTDEPSRPYIANEENRFRADLLRLLITGAGKDCGLTFYALALALALALAFDVVVPLVDIGQKSAGSAPTVKWLGWATRT